MNDDELVARIRRGDGKAAEELIKRHYSSVLRYCRWHCPDREKAEDLTQETFFRLFRNLEQYNGKSKFKAYLYTIANHLCIDESRKRKEDSLEEADDIASGQDEIAQAEHREEIQRLLSVLSAEQREAVLLRFGAELSFREIAKVTGCSMRTAQSRVRNALQIMRKERQDER